MHSHIVHETINLNPNIKKGSERYNQIISKAEIRPFLIRNISYFQGKNILDLEAQALPMRELLEKKGVYFPIISREGTNETGIVHEGAEMIADYEKNKLPFPEFVDVVLSLFNFPNNLENVIKCLAPDGILIHASPPDWFNSQGINEKLASYFKNIKCDFYDIKITQKKETIQSLGYIFATASEPLSRIH
ncbi:MAG: hypothetical protein PHG05_03240 [Candidatus Nanoarchaeia archaeon]|nr:hypothetical protein [Candidatus Nanoarchaeia archaeon]